MDFKVLGFSHLEFFLVHINLSCYIFNTAQKMKFSIKDFFSQVTKPAVSCRFGHIYRRNPQWKTSFFVQYFLDVQVKRGVSPMNNETSVLKIVRHSQV